MFSDIVEFIKVKIEEDTMAIPPPLEEVFPDTVELVTVTFGEELRA